MLGPAHRRRESLVPRPRVLCSTAVLGTPIPVPGFCPDRGSHPPGPSGVHVSRETAAPLDVLAHGSRQVPPTGGSAKVHLPCPLHGRRAGPGVSLARDAEAPEVAAPVMQQAGSRVKGPLAGSPQCAECREDRTLVASPRTGGSGAPGSPDAAKRQEEALPEPGRGALPAARGPASGAMVSRGSGPPQADPYVSRPASAAAPGGSTSDDDPPTTAVWECPVVMLSPVSSARVGRLWSQSLRTAADRGAQPDHRHSHARAPSHAQRRRSGAAV